MNPLRVAVLMGGPSAEREVSMQSGRMAAKALANAGAIVHEVHVQDQDFVLPQRCDVAFIALHGAFGEDGTVQRILEERGVPYTGSGPEASELAMDKSRAKARFMEAGIPTPNSRMVERDLRLLKGMPLPAVVKPARQGSSVGISIARTEQELHDACLQAWHYDQRLLVEEFVDGREFTVGILGRRTLPVVEICTPGGFFDFHAKYTPGGAEELVPAPLDSLTAARMQDIALRAHECLECRDVSRVDIMMDREGEMFVLEINTIPGMTATSLLPKAADAAGISFEDLCIRLVQMALDRKVVALEQVS